MYKRMLVPLDGSKHAEIVLAYAKELVARMGLEVFLFNVFNPEEADPIIHAERIFDILKTSQNYRN